MSLPESIRTLAALIGLPAASVLVNTYGGLVIHVPTGRNPNGKVKATLVDLLGDEAAQKLIINYGGERLNIPRCQADWRDTRDRQIIAEFSAGVPAGRLARRYGMTDRNVRNILKRSPRPAELPSAAPQQISSSASSLKEGQ